jgi:hypothetical protein
MTDIIYSYSYFIYMLHKLAFTETKHGIYSEQKYLLGNNDIGTSVREKQEKENQKEEKRKLWSQWWLLSS